MDYNRNQDSGGGGRHYRDNHRWNSHGGRRRDHRHQPYQSRGGRGGGRGGRGPRSNRFGPEQQDRDLVEFKKISSFVSRVAEFKNLQDPPEDYQGEKLRSVEFTTASNINLLVPTLCAPDKLEFLLKYSADATKPEDKVGKLVHLLVSCVANLPMQTPGYVALTVAFHERVKLNPQYEGLASRCLQYTMLQIAKELDTTLLLSTSTTGRSTCRLKLLLRYLCGMAQVGVLHPYQEETAIDSNRLTLMGLFIVLVDAATAATEQFNSSIASQWLAVVVLSTVPYLMEVSSIPQDLIQEKIYKPLERLLANYRSTFTPGTGMTALLLKGPQVEEYDEEEDEDDEEDDEEEEGSGVICDSMQDLLRATRYWRKEGQVSRFALPLDAPWKGLLSSDDNGMQEGAGSSQPVTYSDQPLFLSFPQECQLLTLLLGGAGSDSPLKLQLFSLEGAVFGRLPIFGSPPNPEDDDDDDEEDMDEGIAKNENLQAFQSMSLLDRYFVAESIRDCLLCHESNITASGLEYGGAKSTAEELLKVGHAFSSNPGEDASRGMEYAVLETIFALLAQSTEFSTMNHAFLSRVLLELTRLEPSRFSQALLLATTNLFQHYLPSLVPSARENYSRWFAFHLTNTDYQWPSAYWQVWEPYAISEKQSSRGAFVRRALTSMTENLSDPTLIVKQCFRSVAQSLVGELLGRPTVSMEECPPSLVSELHQRIVQGEGNQAMVSEYVLSDEISSELSGASKWARTDLLFSALLGPARKLKESTKAALEKASAGDATEQSDDDMVDDQAISADVLNDISKYIALNKATIASAIAKDCGSTDEDVVTEGMTFILQRVESEAGFNRALMEFLVAVLVKHEIVTLQAVVRWALRDSGESGAAPVMSNWAKCVINALREGLLLMSKVDTFGGTMIIDDGTASSEAKIAHASITNIASLLQYTVKRVCNLLTTTSLHNKRLSSLDVELVEGTKTLVSSSRQLIISMLTRSAGVQKGLLASDVEDQISKSECAASSLAALCTGDATSTSIKMLKTSLEQM